MSQIDLSNVEQIEVIYGEEAIVEMICTAYGQWTRTRFSEK